MPRFERTVLKLALGTLAAAAAASAIPNARWDLNDVSILLPLPRNEAEARNLYRLGSPSDEGKTLFPESVHEELVSTFDESERKRLRALYPKWAAVSFRVDPCFRERLHDLCERQVRVVWQPLVLEGERTKYEDAALHTFYTVSDAEWPKLVADLRRVKDASPKTTIRRPLGVHPGFVDGLGGAFSKEFHRRILPWVHQSRLNRLAVFIPTGNGEHAFKRFHVFESTAKLRLMPNWVTDRSSDSLIAILYGNAIAKGESTRDFLAVGIDPSNPPSKYKTQNTDDDLQVLLANSKNASRDRDLLVRFSEIQRRVADPTKHASLSIDCLTCHASGVAKAFLDRELGFFEKRRVSEKGFANPSDYDLTNASAEPASLVRFRAFGYFGAEVSILDRTIHESAAVAEALNRAEK